MNTAASDEVSELGIVFHSHEHMCKSLVLNVLRANIGENCQ